MSLKTCHSHYLCGEIVGIVGPNGAGKSSMLKAFIGEFKATELDCYTIAPYILNSDILLTFLKSSIRFRLPYQSRTSGAFRMLSRHWVV